MDWDWTKFVWGEAEAETETENELTKERISDTLSVESEKKNIKNGKNLLRDGGNDSEERLKKGVSKIRVSSPRSQKRDCDTTCLVDGCKANLSNCKAYHRRHRVCERHSKIPVVLVRGEEKRFCQQCSRFHFLGEFDEAKRSCRKRLDGHNRRRRKPQPESIYLTAKDFLSNFKGPRILQFSSSQFNIPDMDGKIGLAPCVRETEAEAIANNRKKRMRVIDQKTPPNPSSSGQIGDKQFSFVHKDVNQSTPQISERHPLPITNASLKTGGGNHGIAQPVNSGYALYLLSSPPTQASGLGLSCFDFPQEYYNSYSKESPAALPQDLVLTQLSPSLPTSWE